MGPGHILLIKFKSRWSKFFMYFLTSFNDFASNIKLLFLGLFFNSYTLKNESEKIAIRVSNHYPIKALFESFNGLLVSTSANISGEKNIDLVEDLIKTFHHEDVGFYNGKLGNNIKPTRIIDLNSREIIRD